MAFRPRGLDRGPLGAPGNAEALARLNGGGTPPAHPTRRVGRVGRGPTAKPIAFLRHSSKHGVGDELAC